MPNVQYWLDVEVPEIDESPKFDDASLELLAQYRERWRVRVWEPYKSQRGARRTLVFDAVIATHDTAETFSRERFELQTSEELFDQLLELYTTGGLHCIYQLAKHVNSAAGGLAYHTRRFVNVSMELLDALVAGCLKEIESEATRAAATQFESQLDTLDKLGKCFLSRGPDKYELYVGKLQRKGPPPPIDAKDRLYELYKTCFKLKRSIGSLQKKIDDRNSKDGGGTPQRLAAKRKKDAGRQTMVDQFLKPQRELIKEFMRARAEIENIFPPAAYALQMLEEDILDFLPIAEQAKAAPALYRKSRDVQLKYDTRIYFLIRELEAELRAARDSLACEGTASRVDEYLDRDFIQRTTELGGLHHCILDFTLSKRPGLRAIIENGATQGIFGVYFTAAARKEWAQANRVMGNPGVVFRLEERNLDRLPTLRGIVLTHYRIDLERRFAEMTLEESRSHQRWHYVEVAFAIAGLLVAAISIPFGAGAIAVPAGLTFALSILHSALAIFGLVLMVKSITGLIEQNLQARDELQNELIAAGQLDPEALREVGALAARNRELFNAATSGLALEVVKLALAHKLKPIAFALDLDGYLDDVEMLQASTGLIDESDDSQDETAGPSDGN